MTIARLETVGQHSVAPKLIGLDQKFILTSLAYLIAFSVPIRTPFASWLTWGMVLGVVIPVMLTPILGFVLGRWLVIGAVVSVLAGYATTSHALSVDTGRKFSDSFAIFQVGTLVGLLATVTLALWSMKHIGVDRFLFAWSLGLVVRVFIVGGDFTQNPWKYGLALPCSVALLVIGSKFGKAGYVGSLSLIGFLSLEASFRSWILIVGASVFALLLRKYATSSGRKERLSLSSVLLLVATISAASALGLLKLATSGVLGEKIAKRTSDQIAVGGNILLGGRPEWGGAFALFKRDPLGFGLGTSPSVSDTLIAIRSMPFASTELQNRSTIASYFKAGTVSFHSTFWNFWGNYGVAGMVYISLFLACMCYVFLLIASGRPVPFTALPVLVLLGSQVWDVLFSPTLYQTMGVCFAVALIALRSADRERSASVAGSVDEIPRNLSIRRRNAF